MRADKVFNILIVDDHVPVIEGYKSMLSSINANITTACNCETAYHIITAQKNIVFDLILLDLSIPAFEKQNIRSGQDLALLIKKHRPESKIMILTSYTEVFRIYDIVENTAPDGLFIKDDINTIELLRAFDLIIKEESYYSKTVKESIKKVAEKDIFLDADNRKILLLLSKGIKTKNLPKHVPLSLRTIKTKKAEIKDILGISSGDDEDLINELIQFGYISIG